MYIVNGGAGIQMQVFRNQNLHSYIIKPHDMRLDEELLRRVLSNSEKTEDISAGELTETFLEKVVEILILQLSLQMLQWRVLRPINSPEFSVWNVYSAWALGFYFIYLCPQQVECWLNEWYEEKYGK